MIVGREDEWGEQTGALFSPIKNMSCIVIGLEQCNLAIFLFGVIDFRSNMAVSVLFIFPQNQIRTNTSSREMDICSEWCKHTVSVSRFTLRTRFHRKSVSNYSNTSFFTAIWIFQMKSELKSFLLYVYFLWVL